MNLMYNSTRNKQETVTASQAILKGLANDGGLFVPASIPALDKDIAELANMSYQEVAYEVMKLYITDFTEEELKNCINRAYDSKFDTKERPITLIQSLSWWCTHHSAKMDASKRDSGKWTDTPCLLSSFPELFRLVVAH